MKFWKAVKSETTLTIKIGHDAKLSSFLYKLFSSASTAQRQREILGSALLQGIMLHPWEYAGGNAAPDIIQLLLRTIYAESTL
jgi:hypothetical protein